MTQNDRNPNIMRPLDEEDALNPYVRKEGETRTDKDIRMKKVRKMLRENITAQVGVTAKRVLKAFEKGVGGDK